MQVAYQGEIVHGQHFTFNGTRSSPPTVQITALGKPFILIMYEPTIPWLHWLVTHNGELVRYVPPKYKAILSQSLPKEEAVVHRYVFALYEGELARDAVPLGRVINLEKLTDGLEFVDAVYFTA